MSKFIKDLVRPYVMDTSLDEGYMAMAIDLLAMWQIKRGEDAIKVYLGLPL
jgi:hypothetical protein